LWRARLTQRIAKPKADIIAGSALSNSSAPGGQRRAQRVTEKPKENAMEILVVQPIVALVAGILILIVPHLLNYIVAVYLILIGLVGLLNHVG
jgi:hypothetical protein